LELFHLTAEAKPGDFGGVKHFDDLSDLLNFSSESHFELLAVIASSLFHLVSPNTQIDGSSHPFWTALP
jgi:hypothetical protein